MSAMKIAHPILIYHLSKINLTHTGEVLFATAVCIEECKWVFGGASG